MPEFSVDLSELIQIIKGLLEPVIGPALPRWVSILIGIGVLFVIVLLIIMAVLFFLSKIRYYWQESIAPFIDRSENQQRRIKRKRFVEYLIEEIKRLDRLEDWSDYRYAELEAEIEAEGQRRWVNWLPDIIQFSNTLRREISLDKALRFSKERLILVEGDPGGGKSVALRHTTLSLAQATADSKNLNSTIPLYINLKALSRSQDTPLDQNLIKEYVINTLNRVNDRDVDDFIEDEFERGLEEGTWLFLFDSFDELPEVLSAVDADDIIQQYSEAISDFLHGMNKCRGIIASRAFRGPKLLKWPRFRILPLSEKRQLELIAKAELPKERASRFRGNLRLADYNIRAVANNPMFLSILCDYAKLGNEFPDNAHTVYEKYIDLRLERDSKRVQTRYGIDVEKVRAIAERIAFVITEDSRLGLSPTRDEIELVFREHNLDLSVDLKQGLDALEYIKLGRAESGGTSNDSRTFSFAHRRFQEYFATCVVMHDPTLVDPYALITDARWRETTVVLCQTQPIEKLESLIFEAEEFLSSVNVQDELKIDDPLEYLGNASVNENVKINDSDKDIKYTLSLQVRHILELMQDGFVNRVDQLPDTIRYHASRIVININEFSSIYYKKMVLEVAGITYTPVLIHLVRTALRTQSQWIKNVAYFQLSHLDNIPDDLSKWVRTSLIYSSLYNQLSRNKDETLAFLRRLPNSSEYQSVLRLLIWSNRIDISIHILLLVFFTSILRISDSPNIVFSMFFSLISLFSQINNFLNGDATRSLVHRSWFFEIIASVGQLLLRGFIVIIALVDVLGYGKLNSFSSELSLLGTGYLIFLMYALFFQPSAHFLSRYGRFCTLPWWILAPCNALYLLFERILAKILSNNKVAYQYISQNRRTLLIFTMAVSASLLLAFRFFLFIETFISNTMIVVGMYAIIGIVVCSAYCYFQWIPWVRSYARWKKWQTNFQTPLSGVEFLDILGKFEHRSYYIDFIRLVHRNDYLKPNEDSIRFVELLLSTYEEHKLHLKLVDNLDSSHDTERIASSAQELSLFHYILNDLRGSINEMRVSFHSPNHILIDETCMLLESLHDRSEID